MTPDRWRAAAEAMDRECPHEYLACRECVATALATAYAAGLEEAAQVAEQYEPPMTTMYVSRQMVQQQIATLIRATAGRGLVTARCTGTRRNRRSW